MECAGASCVSNFKPTVRFEYATTLTLTGVRCEVNKINIYGKDKETKLFSNARSSCLASDLWCQAGDLTIVWEEEIILPCPYQLISQLTLNKTGKIYTSEEHNLLFQEKRVTTECGVKMIETTEGLTLANGNATINLKNATRELKTTHHLLLSDSDFKYFTLNKRSGEGLDKLSKQMCHMLQAMARVFIKQHNEFIKINVLEGQEIVIFNNDGLLQMADCSEITNITIVKEMDQCFEQPEALVQINNTIQRMSLFSDSIVARDKERRRDCGKRTITTLPDGKTIAITQGGQTNLFTLESETLEIAMGVETNGALDFNHSRLLSEEFDPVGQISRLTRIRELNGHLYIAPEINTEKAVSQGGMGLKIAGQIIKEMFSEFWWVMIAIGAVIIIALVLTTTVRRRCNGKRRTKRQTSNLTLKH
jgi:hypothetical protein